MITGASLWDPDEKNCVLGAPVNCCTMALKLVVSVLKRVVGPFLEALDLFFVDLPILPSRLRWVLVLLDMVGVVVVVVVVLAVVVVVAMGSSAAAAAAARGTPPKIMEGGRRG